MFKHYKSQIFLFFLNLFLLLLIIFFIIFYFQIKIENLFLIEKQKRLQEICNIFENEILRNNINFNSILSAFQKVDFEGDIKVFITKNDSLIYISNEQFNMNIYNKVKKKIIRSKPIFLETNNENKYYFLKKNRNIGENRYEIISGIPVNDYQIYKIQKKNTYFIMLFVIFVSVFLFLIFIKKIIEPYGIIEKIGKDYFRENQDKIDINILIKVLLRIKDEIFLHEKIYYGLKKRFIENNISNDNNLNNAENILISIIIYDFNEGFIFFNKEFEEMFNISSNELFQKKINYLDKGNEFYNFLKDFIASYKNEDNFEYKNIVYRIEKNKYKEEENIITLIIMKEEDYSNILKNTIEQIKFEEMGRLASNILHEYRNSISSLSGYLQIIEKKGYDEKYLELMKKEINYIEKISSDFKKFTGNIEPVFKIINLKEFFYDLINELSYDIQIEIKTDNNDDEFFINGDEILLKSAFKNILKNSYEAITEKGENGKIEIYLKKIESDNKVNISIIDNGVGINEYEIDKIFDLFYTTKENGTGLGLPFVRRIILLHNGNIFPVKIDNGAKFNIIFPLA